MQNRVFRGTHPGAKHSIRIALVLIAGGILVLIGFILVAPRGGLPGVSAGQNPTIGPFHVFTSRRYTESSPRYNVIRIVVGVVMIVVGIVLLVAAPA